MASIIEPSELFKMLQTIRMHLEENANGNPRQEANTIAPETTTEVINEAMGTLVTNKRKQQGSSDDEEETNDVAQKKTKIETEDSPSNEQSTVKTADDGSMDYDNMDDQVFLDMLSTAFKNFGHFQEMIQDQDLIQFVRQYTHLIDRECYLKLHISLWDRYYDVSETLDDLKCRPSRQIAEEYSITRRYSTSKNKFFRQLKRFEEDLRQAQINVAELRDNLLSTDPTNEELAMATDQLSSLIYQFVREHQNPMHEQRDHYLAVFQNQATDYLLVHLFFLSNPSRKQTILAKRIWRATKQQVLAKTELAILKRSITPKRVGMGSHILSRMLRDLDDESMTTANIFHPSSSHGLSNDRSEKAKQLKQDILRLLEKTSDGIIVDLEEVIDTTRDKLPQQHRVTRSSTKLQEVNDLIIERRYHMIKRGDLTIEHDLEDH